MRLRQFVMGVVLTCVSAAPVAGQTGPFVEVSADLSPVKLAGTNIMWQVAHLAGGIQRSGQFGWMGTSTVISGGPCSTCQSAGAASDGWAPGRYSGPVRLSTPRTSCIGCLWKASCRAASSGTRGYRHLDFRDSNVRIIQPGLSWYFTRGVLEARGYLVRNLTTATDNQSLLLRGTIDATSRVQVMTGFARGARIFDVSTLPNTTAGAWVAFGSVRLQMSPQWGMELGVGGAHEDPFFSQRTFSLRLRRSFL